MVTRRQIIQHCFLLSHAKRKLRTLVYRARKTQHAAGYRDFCFSFGNGQIVQKITIDWVLLKKKQKKKKK